MPAPAEPSTGVAGAPAAAGAGPAGASPVTLRQLLSHSAGVNVAGFPGYPADAALPTLVQLLDGVHPANSSPVRVDGTRGTYRYSGGGYQIVELLLEDATGRPFAALADDHVLAPLGMTQSAFAPVLPPAWAGEAAAGHRFDGQPRPGGASDVSPEHADS